MPRVTDPHALHRKLDARMMNMIALGGSIGTGIFLASGNAIHLAGPGGTLAAYLITGMMVYFLMTSLGEMAAFMPTAGSFYFYAERFVDPAFGYALGWNYWYNWAVTIASEITAATLVMQFWFPDSSPFVWCSLFLGLIVGFNAFSVRGFGRIEYWFSFIKITVIVLFIAAGIAMLLGLTQYKPGGFAYWTIGDAPFHDGWIGLLSAFMIAGFSFQGTELVGIAASECKDPHETIPKAIRQIFWRILLFYLLSLLVITLLIPYTSAALGGTSIETSPFTLVLKNYGVPFAATLINGIILIAILSAGNSGMYASTRMLWFLSRKKHVPAIFSRLTSRGIPLAALLATASVSLLAFLSSLFGTGRVYFWLLSASSLSGFITWLGIAVSHYRFRKAWLRQGHQLASLPFVAKGYPYAPLLAIALCLIVIAGQNFRAFMRHNTDWHGIVVSYIGLPVFICLWAGYKWIKKTKIASLDQCSFDYE